MKVFGKLFPARYANCGKIGVHVQIPRAFQLVVNTDFLGMHISLTNHGEWLCPQNLQLHHNHLYVLSFRQHQRAGIN